MVRLGHATADEVAAILPTPVAVTPSAPPPNGCVAAVRGGFFCDYLQRHLTQALGITQDRLETGGLTIKTTLRPDLQDSGDRAVLNYLAMGDPLAGMFTAVEPGTGHVLAMSVNRRFGYDVNDPAQESVALNVVASQGAGSTYKVFVAASALEGGVPPWNTITTSDPYVSHVYKRLGGTVGAPYVVQNAGRYPPTLTMVEALVRSSNTYFVALEDQLGSVEGPVRMAQRMGLFSIDPVADEVIADRRGSFTLGAEATSPLALASAYSTLAASGTQCDPTPVTAVLDRTGAPLTGSRRRAPEHRGHLRPRRGTARRGDHARPDPDRRRRVVHRHRHPRRDPGPHHRGQDGHQPGPLLRRLRRLHPAVRRERHGAQPQAQPGRRRLRRSRCRADLARRDGADPRRSARRRLPARGHPAAEPSPTAARRAPRPVPAPARSLRRPGRPAPRTSPPPDVPPGRPAPGRPDPGRPATGPPTIRPTPSPAHGQLTIRP